MRIIFVAGRNGSDRTNWIYGSIQGELSAGGQPVYLVVPEQSTLQAEKELIAFLGASGLMRVRVTSPTRLAQDVFAQVQQVRQTAIGECGLAMALRAATRGIEGELHAYQSVLGYSGFALEMVRLLSELKRFDVDGEAMARAASGAGGALRAKLDDISVICRRYANYLDQRNYIDADDRFNRFISTIPDADFLRGCSFYFDGFDYLSPQNCRMLVELLRVADRVALSVDDGGPGAADEALFAAGRHNRARLSELAQGLGAAVETVFVRPEEGRALPPDIAHLERNLFAWPAETRPRQGDITVCRASAMEEEVEAAACWILRKARSGGLHWREFAVLSGSHDDYAPVIARTFARYGIPVFIDRRQEIIRHPAVRFILSLLRVRERNFRRDDVLRLAKTGLLGLEDGAVDELERYLTAFHPRGDRAWASPWVKGQSEFDLLQLNQCRRAVHGVVRALLEHSGGAKATGLRWAQAIYLLLGERKLDELLDAHAQALKEQGLLEESAVTEHLWNAVVELLDQLGEIIGDEVLAVGDLADVLQSGFESADIGIIPTGVDQVQAGSIGRAKYSGVRHMLILGACDGRLSEAAESGGVFTDRDIDALAALGLEVSRNSALRDAQRRYALYETVTKGADTLYISWPTASPDNSETEKDRLLDRILELLQIGPDGVLNASELIAGTVGAPGDLAGLSAALGRYLAGGEMDARQLSALKWNLLSPEHGARTAGLLDMLRGEEPVERIAAAGTLLGGAAKVSASQLETYADCPFKHMVEYVLSPTEWRQYRIEGADAGQYIHAVMERFGGQLARSGRNLNDLSGEEAAALMAEVADGYAAEFDFGILQSDARMAFTGSNLKRICVLAAGTYVTQMQNGQFLPYGQEVRLGRGGLPLARIETPDGSFALLDGRIDRLDVYREGDIDYFRVIDYKSGKATIDPTEAINGLDMQTWLYVYALQTLWGSIGPGQGKPAGAYIFPLADPWVEEGEQEERQRLDKLRLNGWCLKGGGVPQAMDRGLAAAPRSALFNINLQRGTGLYEEGYVDAVLKLVARRAGEEVAEMRGGRVAAHPWRRGGNTACMMCGYGALCRFGVLPARRWRQLWNDDEAKELARKAMEEPHDGMDA